MADFSHITKDSSLRDRRHAFSRLLREFINEIEDKHPGWQIVFDEFAIHKAGTNGKGRRAILDGKIVFVIDAVHISKSYHYAPGLAADLILYVDGEWIYDGYDPAWRYISEEWKSKHPLCTAGIDFGDSNHLSFGEGK